MINDTDAEDLSNDCEYGIEVEEEIDEEFVRWEEEEHQRQRKWQQDKGAQAFWGLLEMGRDTLPREVISEILHRPRRESPKTGVRGRNRGYAGGAKQSGPRPGS
jgi:ferric-dicitrate binding protein FerR (iron transport regulator)